MRIRVLALLMLAAAAPAASQENPLATARELYATARYDEALAVLNGMRPTNSNTPTDVKSIEQYRSLCLLALGRGLEAEAAIAAVVNADPTYQPSDAEASPRVRAAFSEVRQRLLPEIARTRYSAAKAAFDRKEYASAEEQFRTLVTLLDDADMGGRLSDLRTLAAGFVDLSAAAVPPPPPEPKKELPTASTPVAPQQPAPSPQHIYGPEDPGVVPPVPIKQELPRVPSQVVAQARDRGLLEVVIDDQGRVVALALRLSVHPMYDTLVLTAARDWRYQPATVNGRPVKYRKMIQISVTRR